MADNAQTVRRFYEEVINGGRLGMIDELLGDGFVEHQEFPGIPPTKDGVKQFFAMWHEAFSGTKAKIDLLVDGGDLVAVYGTWSATHQGEFMGIPSTGKQITVPAADFVRFSSDGKCIEHWGVFESALMLQQLGVIPEMAGATA
jgi:predicted ester cyclase